MHQAHVCVQQTALELLDKGYAVHVVADGTSSRSVTDRLLAFQVRNAPQPHAGAFFFMLVSC